MKASSLHKTIHKATSDVSNAISSLRDEIMALREEREWLETGPLPKSEFIERICSSIDLASESFDSQPPIASALHADRNGNHELSYLFRINGTTNGYATGNVAHGDINANIGPMLCFFFGDQIKEKLLTTVEKMDYQEGPPDAERAALIANIDMRIHDLEVEEESIIETAESVGIEIMRRPDCNPAIVLGLEVIEKDAQAPVIEHANE